MDRMDAGILNSIQSDFPITPLPYRVLGERLGISQGEALERVRGLAESGVIRKIGPSFNTQRLNHASILVAAKVPLERLDEVARIVSSFDEVTHNYGRDSEYNLWFTIVHEDSSMIEKTLDRIKSAAGVADMHALPAVRMFKIKVEFEF